MLYSHSFESIVPSPSLSNMTKVSLKDKTVSWGGNWKYFHFKPEQLQLLLAHSHPSDLGLLFLHQHSLCGGEDDLTRLGHFSSNQFFLVRWHQSMEQRQLATINLLLLPSAEVVSGHEIIRNCATTSTSTTTSTSNGLTTPSTNLQQAR